MKQNTELFEEMSVPKSVAKNAIPAIISMLVVFVYNIADTFFVGQTGDELQVAAVSLTTPIFLLFMAVGTLLGVGGTSVISRALGEGRGEYAKKVSSFCFYSSIVTGLMLMISFWIFMPNILKLIGTSEETIGFARSYLNYVALSAPFVIFAQAFSNIVRAEGKPNEAMFGMMLGTIINIVFDPVMILVMDMGVVGAAVATVIGNMVGAGYYLIYFLRNKSILSISLKDFQISDKIFTGVLSIGIPASLNNILMSVSSVILNNFLAGYGDIRVAAMGVAIRASMIIVLLQIGLGQGIQPLLGYNYGAKNYKRLREVIKFSLMCVLIIGTILTIIYWFGANIIVKAFIDNEAVAEYGINMLKALIISGPVMGIMFVFINALQAMGKAMPSLILSLTRQGFVFIPLLFILNAVSGLTGIVYAQPIADIIAVLISAILYFTINRKLPVSEEGSSEKKQCSKEAVSIDRNKEITKKLTFEINDIKRSH